MEICGKPCVGSRCTHQTHRLSQASHPPQHPTVLKSNLGERLPDLLGENLDLYTEKEYSMQCRPAKHREDDQDRDDSMIFLW